MGTFWSVIGGAVLLAIVGALVWRAYRYTRLIRLIEQTTVHKIADLDGGVASVQGTVVALNEGLKAPLTRRTCVAFSVHFHHHWYVHGGGGDDYFDDQQSVVFALDEGTGRAEIDLTKFTSIWLLERESSRTLPKASSGYRSAKSDREGILCDASDYIKDRARTHYGDRFKHVNFLSQYEPTRYREIIIEEGDPVFALGPVSISDGRIQFTEQPGSRTILLFGTRQDYLAQFRKSRKKCWWASFLVPTVAYVGVRLSPLIKEALAGIR